MVAEPDSVSEKCLEMQAIFQKDPYLPLEIKA